MNWGDKMEKVLVGKVVSTHGIKGEVKILSDFQFKEKAFRVGNKLIIGDKSYEIKSYRRHKNLELITFLEYNNINQVLFLLKQDVFVDKKSLELENTEILDSELLEYEVQTKDGKKGIIKEIFFASPSNKIMRVVFDREVLIPFDSPMVVEISKDKRVVVVELIDGM